MFIKVSTKCFFSSVLFLLGKFGTPFVAAYSASKFALDGFFGALRQEFAMQNMDISVTLCVLGNHFIILILT